MNYFRENELYYRKTAMFLFLGTVAHIVAVFLFGLSEFLVFMAIVMFVAAIDGIFPNIRWMLTKNRVSWNAAVSENDLVPSDAYLMWRKCLCFGSLIVGYFGLAMYLLDLWINR